MNILMEAINYDKFNWKICGDLKVIALLLGLQQVFTKYCCFFVNGTTELDFFITQERFGMPENLWKQES